MGSRHTRAIPKVIPLRSGGGCIRGARVGRIVDFDGAAPRVDYEDNPHGPIVATVAVAQGLLLGAEVVLLFDQELTSRPIIMGVVCEPRLEAKVDGKRVELEGHDEVVLKCGKASIVLRRNGRVAIRGTYVETRSKGVNRIKGGSVQIN